MILMIALLLLVPSLVRMSPRAEAATKTRVRVVLSAKIIPVGQSLGVTAAVTGRPVKTCKAKAKGPSGRKANLGRAQVADGRATWTFNTGGKRRGPWTLTVTCGKTSTSKKFKIANAAPFEREWAVQAAGWILKDIATVDERMLDGIGVPGALQTLSDAYLYLLKAGFPPGVDQAQYYARLVTLSEFAAQAADEYRDWPTDASARYEVVRGQTGILLAIINSALGTGYALPPRTLPEVTPPPPTTTPAQPPVDTSAPGRVVDLRVSVRTQTSIALNWVKPTDPDLVQVVIRRDGTIVYTDLGTLLYDTGLTPATTYEYSVITRDATGNSSEPVVITAATLAPVGSSDALVRVSTDASGNEFGGLKDGPAISADGGRVAFHADGPLVADDTNGNTDVYVKTLATGDLERVSTDAEGQEGDFVSQFPAFSPDGTKVAFGSAATNLVPGDANGTTDVFVKTLATGEIERVSITADGEEARGGGAWYQGSMFPAFSPDGNRIMFVSYAANLVAGDTNGAFDIFIKTLSSGAIERVSTTATGEQASGESAAPVFSPDGRRVAFLSRAPNLVPDDTNGLADIFVKSLTTGEVTRVSTASDGAQAVAIPFVETISSSPSFSPDGDLVAFHSNAPNLVPDDSNRVSDVFVKNLTDGRIVRVSTSASGAQGDSFSDSPTFSPDGLALAFRSDSSNLLPGNTRGWNLYLKRLDTGEIANVSAAPDGTPGDGDSGGGVFSRDGSCLAFASYASNLVTDDHNGGPDVFVKYLR
jgi:Tol biopolymer transport system component